MRCLVYWDSKKYYDKKALYVANKAFKVDFQIYVGKENLCMQLVRKFRNSEVNVFLDLQTST